MSSNKAQTKGGGQENQEENQTAIIIAKTFSSRYQQTEQVFREKRQVLNKCQH